VPGQVVDASKGADVTSRGLGTSWAQVADAYLHLAMRKRHARSHRATRPGVLAAASQRC
jgi:hypothetical protein